MQLREREDGTFCIPMTLTFDTATPDHVILKLEKPMADSNLPEYCETLPLYGDLMDVEAFRNACKTGMYTDYDGHGCPVRDNLMADEEIKPSQVATIPNDATHVMWFNR